MSTNNNIPLVWDEEQDNTLFSSLFPQGLNAPSFGNMFQNQNSNKFPQFPTNEKLTMLSTNALGNKYYNNNFVYQQNGVTIYIDEDTPIILNEVIIYRDRFHKEFDNFGFTVFVSKNGALLLKQHEECIPDSNELVLFLEINDATNFFGSVMRIKVGSEIEKIQLPIAEMITFAQSNGVNLDPKDITKLIIEGRIKSKNSIIDWLTNVLYQITGGTTKFVLDGAIIFNNVIIKIFDELLIDEIHWNSEVKGYEPFFVPNTIYNLIKNEKNNKAISEILIKSIQKEINSLEHVIDTSIELLKPFLPNSIYQKLKKELTLFYKDIDTFISLMETDEFMNFFRTYSETANGFLCGLLNGIVEFFKGVFEIIGMILTIGLNLIQMGKEPAYYYGLMSELFENVIGIIVNFDLKSFVKNAFELPFVLCSKLVTFVKNSSFSPSISINYSKIGFVSGYTIGLIAAIIIDAFLTGGVKAVEDIAKAIETFLTKPGTVLKDLVKTGAEKTAVAVDTIINLLSSMARKLKNGAIKLIEDFKQFIQDIFKWLEEFFGGFKAIKVGSGGFLKYEKIISRNMFKQEELNSCVAACIRQLAKDNGIEITEENIRLLAKTTESGTTAPNTAKAIINIFKKNKEFEFKMLFDPKISDIEALKGVPNDGSWITFIRPDAVSKPHAIIVDKIVGSKIHIRDPWPLEAIDKISFIKSKDGIEGVAEFDDFVKQWAYGGNYVFKIK